MKRRWLAAGLFVIAVSTLFFLMKTTKTGLIPEEDMGIVYVDVSTAPGNSLAETERVMKEIEKKIGTLPQIKSYCKVTGKGMLSGQSASVGMFILRLKDGTNAKKMETV